MVALYPIVVLLNLAVTPPMPSLIKSIVFLLTVLLLSSCGGGGSDSSVTSNVSVNSESSVDYSDYRVATRATELIEATSSANVSVGIFDFGFRTDHQELADRTTVRQNYDDPYTINNLIDSGTYIYIAPTWDWADHGTAVASIAAGRYKGMVPQAEVVSSMNRNIVDSFDIDEYRTRFTKDADGFITHIDGSPDSDGVCVQVILSPFYSWCISFEAYHVQKMQQAASYSMPAVNFSFTIPFGHYQTGVDLSYDEYTSNNATYITNRTAADDASFTGLYGYDFNITYEHWRGLLADGNLLIVTAAGNDGASLTQDLVLDWLYLQATSTDPLAQTIINPFYDPDVDSNLSGTIENSERGMTGGLLFVGALDEAGELAYYSNYAGSSAAVQARFLVVAGDLNVAQPSLGVDGYADGQGTSYASPIVAGAIALLKARYPAKTARQITSAILLTANKDIPDYNPFYHGQGMLDVKAAEQYLYVY